MAQPAFWTAGVEPALQECFEDNPGQDEYRKRWCCCYGEEGEMIACEDDQCSIEWFH